jgi:hypothetical protein
VGKTPDELTPRPDGPNYVREEYSIPFPSGTGRHLGGVEWHPNEPHSELGTGAAGSAHTTPQAATSRDPSSRAHDESHRDSDDADQDEDLVEISEDIEQTRAELTETIDAIQARLAPQHLVEQAKEAAFGASTNFVEETKSAFLGATIGKAEQFVGKAEQMVNDFEYTARDTGESMIDTLKANPLPAAMALFSIGWLMRRRGNNARHAMHAHGPDSWMYSEHAYEDHGQFHERNAPDIRYRGTSGARYGAGVGTSYGGRATDSGLRDRIGGVKEKAGDAVDDAKETVGDVASSATELAGEAADRAARMASTAGYTAVDAGSGFWDMVRRNPVPAAMTGLGIAWLMMNREETRFRPMETVSSVSSNLPVPPVSEITDRARDQFEEIGTGAQHKMYRAQSQFGRTLNDMPLAIGAAAVGLGAAIGLAVPTTSRERELMGDARETLMERTQEVAQTAQQRILHVAETVQETAKEEIQNEFQSGQANQARPTGQSSQTGSSPSSSQSGQSGSSSSSSQSGQSGQMGSSSATPESRAS